jgi:hypothetical protein
MQLFRKDCHAGYKSSSVQPVSVDHWTRLWIDFLGGFSGAGGVADSTGWLDGGVGLIVPVEQEVSINNAKDRMKLNWFFIEYWLK